MTADYARIAKSGQGWLAEQGGCIVGVLVLNAAENHLLLENVAVAPSAQGHGVGGRLLRFAEEQARAHGLHEIRLYTNEVMTEDLAYYSRRGYRETHRATQKGFSRVFFTQVLT